MLHAKLEIAQILDTFQIRCVITEFVPGEDPTLWDSGYRHISLGEEDAHRDALSTVIACLGLWSESTNS